MEKIKFSDFTITPVIRSAKRLKIDDAEYFSPTYGKYISNSRLALINPEQGGSPSAYKEGLHGGTTASLALGSAIHELFLQDDCFTLAPKVGKPTAKLGATIERAAWYRKKGYSIYNSIVNAAKDCDYYVKTIDSKVSDILRAGYEYYIKTKNYDSSVIVLNDKDHDTCCNCINNLKSNKNIMSKIRPTDEFGDNLPSFNEDALFIDLVVTYKNEVSTILKLKMKADNWTIDVDNKILTLNDLKTSSKPVAYFMKDYGSWYHYHYARQMALYGMMLKEFCKQEYNFNSEWTFECNMLVVDTLRDNDTRCIHVPDSELEVGKKEYEELLKRVAYYEIYGYDKNVEFINA